MGKKQDMELYYALLLTFKNARLEGRSKEESFMLAKLALIDYFSNAPHISKQSFSRIWEAAKQKEFTQQLNLDFELIRQKKTVPLHTV